MDLQAKVWILLSNVLCEEHIWLHLQKTNCGSEKASQRMSIYLHRCSSSELRGRWTSAICFAFESSIRRQAHTEYVNFCLSFQSVQFRSEIGGSFVKAQGQFWGVNKRGRWQIAFSTETSYIWSQPGTLTSQILRPTSEINIIQKYHCIYIISYISYKILYIYDMRDIDYIIYIIHISF